MKKETKFILFGVLSTAMIVGIVGSISLSDRLINPSKANKDYKIVCDSGNNTFSTSSSTSILKTEDGSDVNFNVDGTYTPGGSNWLSINKNSYFNNDTDIRCLSSITFNFASAGTFKLNYSKASLYKGEEVKFPDIWKETYTVSENQSLTVDVPAKALHFKFESLTDDLLISSMTINFDCGDSLEWDDANGVNPVIDTATNTLTYGLFPQTHVGDKTLSENLAKKAKLVGAVDEEFFWYKDGVNDGFYVQDTGKPYKSTYAFSDGLTVSSETHYFKCELIKWNIVATNDTNYTLDCSNILYAHRFSNGSSAYNNSSVKAWASGDFYYRAFMLNNSIIQETDLTDVSVTKQKAWLGSDEQYAKDWYKSNEARQKKVSDFALCNYAYMSDERNGYYWTRSAAIGALNNAVYVTPSGNIAANFTVVQEEYGLSPSLTIKNNA